MPMEEIKIFENDEFGRIRMFMDNKGEPWFNLTDLCRAVDLSNPSSVKSRLDKGDVQLVDLHALNYMEGGTVGNTMSNFITESGFYDVLLYSSSPNVRPFRKWVTKEVLPSIRKKGFYGVADDNALPEFIRRFKANMHNIPKDYFSVISEMYMRLYGEFEKAGYKIPDVGKNGKVLTPDISVGKCFADFLRENNSALWNKHKTYKHHFPDGRVVDAYMYPIDALPMFIRYINERWMFEKAEKYFRERDPKALEYLPKLLENKKTA